jgi:O-antigen/teichoic acid export membrane protein
MSGSIKNWSFLDTPVQKSFAWSLFLSLLPVISAFLVSWFVARWAGPAVWGTVSWAMALATAVLIIGKFGLELGASRLASEYGVKKPGTLRALFTTSFRLRIAFTLPVAIATFILAGRIAGWFHNPELAAPIKIAAGVIGCASLYEFKEHFLIGLNRHATVTKVRSVTLSTRVILTILVTLAGWGAVEILAGYCAAWLIGITIFAVLLYRFLPTVRDPVDRTALTRRLMALSFPLAISSASVTIYTQMDKLMLGFFNDVNEVGHYAVARAITEVSLFPAFAFVMTLRPALASRFASGALEECAELIKKSLRISMIFGVLFGAVFAVMAVPLVNFVYSRDFNFHYAGELMGVFIWVIVLRSLGAMVLPALVAAERTKYYAFLTTVSAAINFGLNLVLIPAYQARGAVVATIISYSFLLVLGLRQVFVIFHVRLRMPAYTLAFRTVLAGVIAGLILWLILGRTEGSGMDGGVWVLLWAFLQAVIYFALLVLFKVVRPADVKSLAGGFTELKG